MLRDSTIQSIFVKFLGLRLSSLEGKVISKIGSKKTYKDLVLPCNDNICKLLLQICQITFYNDFNIHELDQQLLRIQLPLIMMMTNQIKDDIKDNDDSDINNMEKSKEIVNSLLSKETNTNTNNEKKKLMIIVTNILLSI